MSFRRTVYNIFFRLSPLLIVVLLELALRFLGVGSSYKMFQDSEDGQNKILNSQHYKLYLCERQFDSLDVLYQEFPKEKEENTYRVFLLSDHTMISAFPATRYDELLPDFELSDGQKIDIINIAVPFTNSFAVKRMAEAIRKQNADACIIFTGQNEFYGLPGKSTWMRDIYNYWGVSSYVRMRNHRFVQMLDRFLYLHKPVQKQFPPEDPDMWVIQADSMQYRENLSYFQRNLNSINKNAKCPILYVNLPVNYKQHPYRSFFDDKELSDAEFAMEFEDLINNADPYTLKKWLNDLYAWEPETAIYYYCKARMEEQNNELEKAIEDYLKAVKLDAFKVRMDEEFKSVLFEAAEYDDNHLIDLESYLKTMSETALTQTKIFKNGIEFNANTRIILSELIRKELTEYFSKEINKE